MVKIKEMSAMEELQEIFDNCKELVGHKKIRETNLICDYKHDLKIFFNTALKERDNLINDLIKLVKLWHNFPGDEIDPKIIEIWNTYLNNSPELKNYREWQSKQKYLK